MSESAGVVVVVAGACSVVFEVDGAVVGAADCAAGVFGAACIVVLEILLDTHATCLADRAGDAGNGGEIDDNALDLGDELAVGNVKSGLMTIKAQTGT